MKKKKRNFTILNARVTSTVSVALVLLILGLVAMTAIGAANITREIKENLGFNIALTEDISPEDIDRIKTLIENNKEISSVALFTADQAMKQWQEATGENVIEIVGVNPFASELDVKVKPEYATTEIITSVADRFRDNPLVEEITMHTDLVDSINRNTRSAITVLAIIALALLLISFVLINNTIRLTVYSRRFIIHTMKLVGATASFIRRPFIISNMVNGLIAGVIAAIILLIIVYYSTTFDPAVSIALPVENAVFVYIAMPLLGMIICSIASLFATNRYLRLDYDDMFD